MYLTKQGWFGTIGLSLYLQRTIVQMSKADEIFIANMRQIIDNGVSDEGQNVRPHWADGTPAHTKKVFCIVSGRYSS